MRVLVCGLLMVWSLAAQRPAQEYWNNVFKESQVQFNHQPSRLLVDAAHDRKPGSAIDLGMGEGRNAIFLAQQGWRVTGVDFSDTAVALAKHRAAQLGIPLETHVADLDQFDFGSQRWDLIAMFYMHAWYHLSKTGAPRRLREALKPGGLLVIEGFAGGETGFQTNELLRDFQDLRILRYEDVEAEADWDPGHKSHIVRFTAEKIR